MVTRYDLTEEVDTGVLDITPVPSNLEGRFVSYQDYEALEVKYLNLCGACEKAQRALNMALPDDGDC